MTISLVVPTYNERSAIPVLFEGLSQVAADLAPHRFEVILVDDGSEDGTVDAARAFPSEFALKIIERSERGLATAVLAGFAAAQGDVIGVMDADLSHPVELIPSLIASLKDADLVIGSRNVAGGGTEQWPWYRHAASQSAAFVTRPLGIRVKDPMSGFFFMKRDVITNVDCSPVGYKILLEILVKGRYKTLSELPYVFRNREVGKSKMGMRETMNYLRHLGRLYAWKLRATRA